MAGVVDVRAGRKRQVWDKWQRKRITEGEKATSQIGKDGKKQIEIFLF
jgi:hypothetical protein